MKIDAFTRQRIRRFVGEHREKKGVLPTLQDFSAAGFSKEVVASAVKGEVLLELYVTLTNGAIVKGYKLKV